MYKKEKQKRLSIFCEVFNIKGNNSEWLHGKYNSLIEESSHVLNRCTDRCVI
jgi:hypothetical protein